MNLFFLNKLVPFSRFEVRDRSMEPLYREREHVLTFNWASVQTRDVIVFKIKDRFYIKRINRVEGGKIVVTGDNKKMSSKFAPVDFRQVVGRVILKY